MALTTAFYFIPYLSLCWDDCNVPAAFQIKTTEKDAVCKYIDIEIDILHAMLIWGIHGPGDELRDNRVLERLSHNQAVCVGSLLRLMMCLEPWCRQKEKKSEKVGV